MSNINQKLYNLLYDWEVWETCDYCEHIKTFRDDGRHPCNQCECCDKFRLDRGIHKDLKYKVNEILKIVKDESKD